MWCALQPSPLPLSLLCPLFCFVAYFVVVVVFVSFRFISVPHAQVSLVCHFIWIGSPCGFVCKEKQYCCIQSWGFGNSLTSGAFCFPLEDGIVRGVSIHGDGQRNRMVFMWRLKSRDVFEFGEMPTRAIWCGVFWRLLWQTGMHETFCSVGSLISLNFGARVATRACHAECQRANVFSM